MRQSNVRPQLRSGFSDLSCRASYPLRTSGRSRIAPALALRRTSVLTLLPGAGECDASRRADGGGIVTTVWRILITLTLAAGALAGAGVVAFGTHPDLARYPHGLDWIIAARRLQWPITIATLVTCLALIGLVVTGKRRAPWLLVLGPVLFLFYHRFAGDDFRRMAILDNPPFAAPEKVTALKPDSPVIGLVVDGQAYAYPCGALYLAPVIVHAEGDKRVLVMYSPYAGRARAFFVDATIKPRELDVVSMPANAMLLYNSRIGQFVNAFTGATPGGNRPDGFVSPIELRKLSWREWRTLYPDTRVLATAISTAGERPQGRFPPRPAEWQLAPEARLTLLSTPRPAALQVAKLTAASPPLNLVAGGENLLVFRDKASGQVRIFDRAVKGDLFSKFARAAVAKKPEIAFVDLETASHWTADGLCVDGYAKGERLKAVHAEDDLPYGTLKSFYPELELIKQ